MTLKMPPRRRSHVASKYLKTGEYDFSMKNKDNKLGKGAFGEVYKITRTVKGEKTDVAMKFILQSLNDAAKQKDYMREVEVLALFDHPTLLNLIGFTIPMGQDSGIMLATPYLCNGNLHNVMKLVYAGRAPDGFNETKKSCCALGIAVGMMLIHQKNVIHRDLKSENVLLDDDFYPVIADFGLSKILSANDAENKTIQMTLNKGTPLYMAPELFEGDIHYTQKVDVYAYAMILYELCTGLTPFQDKGDLKKYTLMSYVTQNIRPTIYPEVPNSYRELMEACWDNNPDNRPSFEDIIRRVKDTDLLIFDGADIDEYQDYESRILEGIDI